MASVNLMNEDNLTNKAASELRGGQDGRKIVLKSFGGVLWIVWCSMTTMWVCFLEYVRFQKTDASNNQSISI